MSTIREIIQWAKAFFYAHVTIYYLHWKYGRRIDIRNSRETLEYILSHRVSVSRFGDGEIDVIAGRGNGMQTPNKELGKRLEEVLRSDVKNHLVTLPYGWKSTSGLVRKNKLWWTWFVAQNYELLTTLTSSQKTYYDTQFTRFYMDIADKHSEAMDQYVRKFRKIWEGRDIYLVEGEHTRFGIDNDLLETARTVKRIICPSKNAFDKYCDILDAVSTTVPKDALILCALGMTATVLAYDLAKAGYQAIDIGHADIEYEWYRRGAEQKVAIEGKNVNELGICDPESEYNETYENQIIAKIL